VLRGQYEIDPVSLGPVAGGEDPSATAYRVETGHAGRRYFVKVRDANGSRDVAAAVCAYLAEGGLPHVVPPLRSSTNSVTVEDGELSFTVYPFIEGRTGVEAGLVERHWLALGAQIRRLHASVLPSDLSARVATETYRPAALDVVRRIDRVVASRSFAGRIARDVAAFWTAHRAEIRTLVERTEALGRQVERLSLPLVLCHADLHTWNVIIDGDGEPWLIDWDEVVHAPKERDLMFVIGGIGPGLVDPHETRWFLDGYGDTTVDPLALSYYRHAWAVQDIGGYGERILFDRRCRDESRSDAARILTGLFGAGEIVDLALASDAPSQAAPGAPRQPAQ
jgi:spectinomycin phosphotransferase